MPTTLRAGDVAFARFNSDNPDSFSFVPLVPLEAGTVIFFTDNAWNADGTLRATEGTVTYTAEAAVAAGTTVTVTAPGDSFPGTSGDGAGSGGFALSTAGDSIIAYQGALGAPERVLAAVSTAPFIASGTPSASTSYLPGTGTAMTADDLVVGESAVVLSPAGVDNGVWSGGNTVGTAAALRASLNDATLWTTSEDAVAEAPPAFTVTDGAVPAAGVSASPLSVSVSEGGASGTFTVVLNTQPVADVVIPLNGDAQAAAGASSLTFTAANWNVPQSVSVLAVDDAAVEGAHAGTILLGAATSADPAYAGLDPADVAVRIADNDLAAAIPIGTVQGAGHRSTFAGTSVTVRGVVTAVDSNGFYLQDAGDGNLATSDAVFVFTSSRPTVTVGQGAQVTGVVSEFLPGNSAANLTTTQIGTPAVTVLDAPVAGVTATVLGAGGRVAPAEVAQDDNFTSFDIATDGVDFLESLEAMLIRVADAVVVQGTNSNNENWVLPDNGAGATGRTPRGGVLLTETDKNPEKVQIQYDAAANNVQPGFAPTLQVADRLGDVQGVLSYNFGQYELLPTVPFTVTDGGLRKEVTALVAGAERLTVADYNVENLDPGDGQQRFDALAADIVGNLRTPDILALQEIQDNNGAVNDGVTSASLTGQALIDAILRAGGPRYTYADIPPVDDTSGGEPGGNIRPGFLYRADRAELLSLEQVAPADPAFANSRVPLVGNFGFNGDIVTLINVHYSSKGGGSTDFGAFFPPVNGAEAARIAQAQVTNSYVDAVLAERPGAKLLVIGDHNEFSFEDPQIVLRGDDDGSAVLRDLNTQLPVNERYTYTFDGNSQDLDHTLATRAAFAVATYDAVHINSEFADLSGARSGLARNSDHDPQLTALDIAPAAAIEFAIARVGLSFGQNYTYRDEARTVEQSSNAADDDTLGTLGRFSQRFGDVVVTSGEFSAAGPRPFTVTIANPATLDWISDTAAVLRGDQPIESLGQDLSVSDFTGTALRVENWRTVELALANTGPLVLDVQGAGGGFIALGAGADTLRIGSDQPATGFGAFAINTGAGDDAVSFVPEDRDYTPGRSDPAGLLSFVALGDGDDAFVGSEGADQAQGEAGDDLLRGAGGADTLDGGAGADRLFGENGDDVLAGGAGDDVLEGGAGADRMTGGDGDDIYVVDGPADAVIETNPVGYDTVIVTGSSFLLPFNVEVMLGTDIAQRLEGSAGADLIAGFGGDDVIYGGLGDDRLEGGTGNDVLEGGPGTDTTVGGLGDDIHVVGNNLDTVIELAGGGIDTVIVTGEDWYQYGISGSPEIEVIVGTELNQTLVGTNGNQIILGNGGDDLLQGGFGDDTLVGGAGRDAFRFQGYQRGVAYNDAEGRDVLADFVAGEDSLVLLAFEQRSFEAVLEVATQQGADAVLALTSRAFGFGGAEAVFTETVVIANTSLAQLSAADFSFG